MRRSPEGERRTIPTGAFAKAALNLDSLSFRRSSASFRSVMSLVIDRTHFSPSISMSSPNHAGEEAAVLASEFGLEVRRLVRFPKPADQGLPVLGPGP